MENPNYEAHPSYSFTVVATDGAGHSTEQVVTLGIHNLDEVAPEFTSGTTATAIDENSGAGQVVYTAIAADPALDDGPSGSVFYDITGADAASFAIDHATGEVTLVGDADYEFHASGYHFTVTAADALNNVATRDVTLAVNNLDEVTPTITSGGTALAIDENSGANQTVYTATATDLGDISGGVQFSLKAGADSASFFIDADSGAVTLVDNPNFEDKQSYTFTVMAADNAGHFAEQLVTLGINNRDEVAPGFTSGTTATAINENSGANQVVYTAAAVDPVTDGPSDPILYSLAGLNVDAFAIDSTTGVVTLVDNPDFETHPNYSFDVTATDTAGNATTQTVTLAINDGSDAPVITSGGTGGPIGPLAATYDVVENTTAVTTVTAIDSDVGSTYGFSISGGADASKFLIDAATGALSFVAAPDYEAPSDTGATASTTSRSR